MVFPVMVGDLNGIIHSINALSSVLITDISGHNCGRLNKKQTENSGCKMSKMRRFLGQ